MEQLLTKAQYIKTDTAIKSVKSRKKKQAKITWEKVSRAERYIIQYAAKANFSGAKNLQYRQIKSDGSRRRIVSKKEQIKNYTAMGKPVVVFLCA